MWYTSSITVLAVPITVAAILRVSMVHVGLATLTGAAVFAAAAVVA